MAGEDEEHGGESGTGVVTSTQERVKSIHPKMYRVILLNDDYTSMDFVIAVLESIFRKSPAEAVQIMLSVHQKGRGTAGIYPKQIAEAKIAAVHDRAHKAGYPLRCTMEPE